MKNCVFQNDNFSGRADDLSLDGIPHLELELTVLLVEREHAKVVVAREVGKPSIKQKVPGFEIFFMKPPEVCESVPAARIASLLPGKVVVITETIWSTCNFWWEWKNTRLAIGSSV